MPENDAIANMTTHLGWWEIELERLAYIREICSARSI